jgi:hypothetical protein
MLRPTAALAAAFVVVGIAGAGPASAAPKPRLPITLTAQPANPSPSNAAGFAWTTVVGATYTCSLDGAASTPCTSTASYVGLVDGTHTFVLKGRLQGSYRPGSKIVTWSVDTTPPGAPTVAPVGTPTRTTSALISFTNNDPTAVAHTCALDGASPVTCTSPWATGTVAEGSHTVVVRSRDAFGVLGASASVSWVVDLTAPIDVLLTGPASPWASSTADFMFSAPGATTFGCALDSAASVACTSPYQLTGLAEGPHSLTVSASDGAGNSAQPAIALWTIDTTAPAAPTVVTGPASPTNQTTVDLVAGNLDGSSTLQCRLDSTLPAAWAACPTPLHWSGLSAGTHTIDLRAADAAGNTSTVVSVSWLLDLTAPAPAQFAGGPASFSRDRLPAFDFFLTDSSASGFLCSLDAAPYVACDIDTVPLPASPGLAEGPHILQVESVDAASNASAPVSWSWNIDLTAPAPASFTATPTATTTDTTARLGFTVETGAVLTCSVDGGPLGQCSSPYTLTGLALGAHSFAVTAADAAGNVGPTSSYSWTVTAPVVSPPPVSVPPPAAGPPAATTVTVSAARALLGRSTATFSANTHGVTAGIAPAVGIVTVACADAAGASVSCAAGPVRTVAVTHASPLVPGQRYTLTVSGTDGQARSVSGVQSLRASTDEQESSLAASYRWRTALSSKAYGRSYLVESAKGATASVAFSGTAITWFTMTGPAEGRAWVYVDGVKRAKVNNWSAATRWHIPRTVSGLKPGAHRLRIVVSGTKGSTTGVGTDIVLDAVKVGKKLLAAPATVTTWRRVATAAASGGAYTASAQRGATASFAFRGTSLTWVTARGPAMGKAKMYVDGVLKTTVDNYAKRTGWNARRTVTGLSDARHTVKIVVTGKRRASAGTTVVVDRWLVG